MKARILRTAFSKTVLGLCLWCAGASAQIITTVAGTDWSFPPTPLPALNAPLGSPSGMAADAAGNLYVADPGNYTVVRMSPDGTLTVAAGNGIFGFSGDGGPATNATLAYPQGVAVDTAGNLYIADSTRIRKVSGGIITTIAGNGTSGYSGDGGPATSASLKLAQGVAVDAAGNLYIADLLNFRIRKVSDGIITTVAGGGSPAQGNGDGGPATSASLSFPQGVAVDSAGNLYIADFERIREVSGGIITTVAGGGNYPSTIIGDGGPATSAILSIPVGIVVDSAGDLYFADSGFGYEAIGGFDSGGERVRKVSAGIITTVAGNGLTNFSGDGGAATAATLDAPGGVAVSPAGDLYIADTGNRRVRMVSGGIISTVAGNGGFKFAGDGRAATSASFNGPDGIALDAARCDDRGLRGHLILH